MQRIKPIAAEAGLTLPQVLQAESLAPVQVTAVQFATAAQVEQMCQAHVEFATARRGKEILGRDLVAEGMLREGEMFAVHQKSSSSFRSGRPGGG